MPSKTKRQAAAMRAAAYGKLKKGGIPRSVAKKYVAADKAAKAKPRR